METGNNNCHMWNAEKGLVGILEISSLVLLNSLMEKNLSLALVLCTSVIQDKDANAMFSAVEQGGFCFDMSDQQANIVAYYPEGHKGELHIYQMLSQTNYRDCRADGWSNDVPHCEVKKCFPVEPPENGRIVMTGIHGLDQDFIFGQALRFECNPEFRIVGAKQIVCADGGQWHPSVPTCQEIICKPGNIANGYITSLKGVYKEGDELQFDCRTGYKPVDRSVAVCSENGWNTRLECIEVVCSRPEVDNGNVSPHRQRYSYEETIEIQCNPGYEPERRQKTSQCNKNGWIPQPKCVCK
ncbi:UNVERIFIED_CONTAM: hypothetical protein K2H54_035372 [Gekko kuhli]